jgi:hypothetical protein
MNTKDLVLDMLRGRRLPDIAGSQYSAIRKRLNRENVGLGASGPQRAAMELMCSLGLWSDPAKDLEELDMKQDQVISAANDIESVSYVMTLPPDLNFVYINPYAEVVYRVGLEDARGKSVWEIMAMREVYSRLLNLREYHVKGIKVCKALIEASQCMGSVEHERVTTLLAPYISFAGSVMPDLWESTTPEFPAVYAEYRKELTHWRPRGPALLFDVRWNYRSDWSLIHVTYQPIDGKTGDEMADLTKELIQTGKLQ